MSATSYTKHGISFLLLLIFFQQIGGGLFIHNLLHADVTAGQSPIKPNQSAQEINFNCNCVDNFLMPFAEANEPPRLQNLYTYTKPINSCYTEKESFTSLIFFSRRGPPSSIS